MITDQKITTAKLSEKLGISTSPVEKNIVKLRKHNTIKRCGSTKSGYWEIIKQK